MARDVCRLFRAHDYDSELDSRLTVDQEKAYNRVRAAYCKGE